MAVHMRVHCSVCRYTWDRTINLDDEEIECPACGNSQENFDAKELSEIETIQRRQSFLAMVATLAIVGGVVLLVLSALMVDPGANKKSGDLKTVNLTDTDSLNKAADRIFAEKRGDQTTAADASQTLVDSLKVNARVVRVADDEVLDEQLKAAVNTSVPNKKLYDEKYTFQTSNKTIFEKKGYSSLQVILGVFGILALLAGFGISFPAQSSRYLAEI